MIRDRGTIKWTAMMLPEHVTLIREMKAELNQRPKPELDMQKLEEINETFASATAEQRPVVVTYYDTGVYRHVIGYVHDINSLNGSMTITDFFDERIRVPLASVLDVQFHH